MMINGYMEHKSIKVFYYREIDCWTCYKVTLIIEANSSVFSSLECSSVQENLVKSDLKKDRKLVQPEVKMTRCARPDHSQPFHCYTHFIVLLLFAAIQCQSLSRNLNSFIGYCCLKDIYIFALFYIIG